MLWVNWSVVLLLIVGDILPPPKSYFPQYICPCVGRITQKDMRKVVTKYIGETRNNQLDFAGWCVCELVWVCTSQPHQLCIYFSLWWRLHRCGTSVPIWHLFWFRLAAVRHSGRRAGDRRCWRHNDLSNYYCSDVNCQSRKKKEESSTLSHFSLCCQHKQLQTSPFAASGPPKSAYSRGDSM